MNSINISVRIDQKAALLAGRVLDKTALVECSFDSIGDQWPALVTMLDMSSTPPSANLTVDDPTPEAVRMALIARAEAAAAEVAAKAALEALQIAQIEAKLAEIETASRSEMAPDEKFAQTPQLAALENNDDGPFKFLGWKRELPYLAVSTYNYPESSPRHALNARHEEIRARNEAEIAAADALAIAAALPRFREEIAQRIVQRETDAAAKKQADAERYAARLESGYWEKETGGYNEKRYGAWWCATVDFSVGAKGNYEFGETSGSWGKAGTLRVKCAPGDFIAYGQKDLRRTDRSDHYVLRMRANGSMENFDDKASAYKAYRESQKVTA